MTKNVNTVEAFTATLTQPAPPADLSDLLKALWYDGAGDWSKAHAIAQDISGPMGAHIHAYLHRTEGDQWNAQYWYDRAGKTMPGVTLEEEWALLVQEYLEF